ncbi:N-acetylmuramidase domain-containing protein [Mucilaginibacter litoreus]|uniref:N-acetylmuramidase domain-containing protein n=1 Tax=Mucilaginibacter litoreus TaxID=1048221 RepID=A0ABW3AQH6_9SPHI
MNLKLNNAQLYGLAMAYGYDYRALKAIIQVESGQTGFSKETGRLIIQFEPAWFKRFKTDWQKDTSHKTWQANKVGNQTSEWIAFNDAFALDADAAMKSTSVGMMQIMGFHYAELGFQTVGEMWDFAKVSEYNQVELALKWIKTIPALDRALQSKNWQKVAYYYNGAGYKRFNYDKRLADAHSKASAYLSNN